MIIDKDIEHLKLYSEDVHQILESCNLHNISLNTCRQIIELMAPICDYKSPSGSIQWLKNQINTLDIQKN